MLSLMVTLKDRLVLRRELDLDTVRVGRAPTNEVYLDSKAISREHCVLRRDPARGTWTIEDLGSSNGTFVNGARVTRADLRTGDAVGVGPFSISIRAGSPGADSVLMVPTPGAGGAPELRELAAPLKGVLELTSGGSSVFLERDLFQIGADPSLDLFARGPRKQALIVRGHGGFQLVNAGPDGGGVLLDGAPVEDRAWLRDGARLEVGELKLVFRLSDGPAFGGSEQTMQMNVAELRPRPSPPS
jgi:pSer/pThr/pTyr-binding forkhead associated (FHA) protein